MHCSRSPFQVLPKAQPALSSGQGGDSTAYLGPGFIAGLSLWGRCFPSYSRNFHCCTHYCKEPTHYCKESDCTFSTPWTVGWIWSHLSFQLTQTTSYSLYLQGKGSDSTIASPHSHQLMSVIPVLGTQSRGSIQEGSGRHRGQCLLTLPQVLLTLLLLPRPCPRAAPWPHLPHSV